MIRENLSRAKWGSCAVLIVALVCAVHAYAAETAAGTVIANTARVNFKIGTANLTESASAYITVQQIVNVTVTWQNASDVSVAPGSVQQSLLFKVTNTGNGADSFTLADSPATVTGTPFTPADCQIYYDSAGTGVYGPTDQLYTPGNNDPALAQNAALNMLVVCNVPSNAADLSLAAMNLAAVSKTASGTAGTVKAGGGAGGVDAIVGASGGKGNATGTWQVHNVAFTYTKSAAIVGGPSGSQPVSGAVIQYTLTVTPGGSATAQNVVVGDAIPVNTTFVPGSLLLNGVAVTPTVGDYNVTTPGAITVRLGNVAGSASADVVQFLVKIN